jgi:hypothetical protein
MRKLRLVPPLQRLRIRAEASAAETERLREQLAQRQAKAELDAVRLDGALAQRARRDAERQMRGAL